jgi:hypothetical protein
MTIFPHSPALDRIVKRAVLWIVALVLLSGVLHGLTRQSAPTPAPAPSSAAAIGESGGLGQSLPSPVARNAKGAGR